MGITIDKCVVYLVKEKLTLFDFSPPNRPLSNEGNLVFVQNGVELWKARLNDAPALGGSRLRVWYHVS